MKSPLRYPGGKSRLAAYLVGLMPPFRNYFEPFLGGGSVMLEVRRQRPEAVVTVSDIDWELIQFWITLKVPQTCKEMHEMATNIRTCSEEQIRWLCNEWRAKKDALLGHQFYVLNRCSFSGTIRMGGLGPGLTRFTQKQIDSLLTFQDTLKPVQIMQASYEQLFSLTAKHTDTFFFLDPPYIMAKGLYRNGQFNHSDLAATLRELKHPFMLTLDDCSESQRLYSWAKVQPLEFTYSMNNCSLEKKQKKGKELVITNY